MAIEEGKSAPLFTLKDQNGDKVALKDFKGKHVIVYFYPKDDTPGCTKEACGFRDLWSDFEAHDIVVLGVSPDDGVAHEKFIDKYSLPFTLLSDPDKKVMEKYGAWGEKMMYGKKTVGVIRSTVWIDPAGKVAKHWKRVAKAETHPDKVLENVRKALE
ncbi:MAG: peroxiredoxin [marine bacterium B5-7]|nr:MAG: peroxiredoxin [marine bacterium B5-7]